MNMDVKEKLSYVDILSEGRWDDNISWQFIVSERLPDENICSAVCCVVVCENKLILVRNKRGWELPAGHVEDGEDIQSAVTREVIEETGLVLEKPPRMFGYKKLTAKSPVLKDQVKGSYYPYPHSYVGFFFAEVKNKESLKTWEDIYELRFATLTEAKELLHYGGQYEGIIDFLISKKLITVDS